MKRTLTTFALTISTALAAFAQQDPQFSQNMFNKLATNPGYAGTNNAICATLLGRQQWMGFIDGNKGIPKTYLLSVDSKVDAVRGGLGLTVLSDQLGFEKNFMAKLAYSYHIQVGAGVLGIGPEIGMIQKSLGGAWVATDGWQGDPAIPTSASAITYDIGFGAFYTIPQKLYFGISSTHLTESDLSKSESRANPPAPSPLSVDYNYTIARHYYVTAGYRFDAGQSLALEPSVFVKSDAASTQLDVNLRAIYNNMFWGGVSYRLTDAIVAMVGIEKQGVGNPNGTLKVGYSYDVTTSSIKNHSSGSHELMLGYCFKLPEKKHVTIHENVRFP
jgi:type IX secretion system PorP/SprF family membrane protein